MHPCTEIFSKRRKIFSVKCTGARDSLHVHIRYFISFSRCTICASRRTAMSGVREVSYDLACPRQRPSITSQCKFLEHCTLAAYRFWPLAKINV